MQCSAHKPFVSCSIFMPSLVFFTPRLLRLSLRPDRLSALQKFICCIPDQWNLILSSTLSCNFYTRDTLWKPRARAHTHTHTSLTIFTAFIFLLLLFFSPTSRLKIWSSRSAPTSYEDFLSLDFLSAPLPSFRLYYMRSSF